jgi:alkylation response protein AidB-like acyl-CoA dehydrogenase
LSPWMNDELALYRETVVRFVESQMVPHDARWREEHNVGHEIWRRAGELGLLCADIPSEYGGAGGDFRHEVVLYEELARRALNGFGQGVHSIAAHYLLNYGTEEQKRRYLPRLASGEITAAFSLSEPGAGSDAAAISTRAVRKGDRYVLNGVKLWVSNGSKASVITLFATVDRGRGKGGVTAFLIEPTFPGFAVGKLERKLGIRGSPTAALHLSDCEVPVQNRLGEEGEGYKIALSVLDGSRPAVGAEAVGIGQAALDAAVAYAKERQQFGQPIAAFQGIQFMLADMAMAVHGSRLLVHHAAALVDRGAPAALESSMAKCFAGDTAMKVATDAVQIFGGYGYTREYPVERFLRDAKITQIYEGTNQIQRVVIARELTRR